MVPNVTLVKAPCQGMSTVARVAALASKYVAAITCLQVTISVVQVGIWVLAGFTQCPYGSSHEGFSPSQPTSLGCTVSMLFLFYQTEVMFIDAVKKSSRATALDQWSGNE